MVRLPVIRVPLQYDSLPCYVLLHAKRTQPCDLIGWRVQRPCLVEFSFAIGFFQQMPEKHRQAIKQPLGSSVGARQGKSHGVGIQLGYEQGLAIQDQQVTLRRANRLVKIERE